VEYTLVHQIVKKRTLEDCLQGLHDLMH